MLSGLFIVINVFTVNYDVESQNSKNFFGTIIIKWKISSKRYLYLLEYNAIKAVDIATVHILIAKF